MVPYLPPETIDSIIDYLHADKPSLFACGLTCRSWQASSRFHLFSNVKIGSQNIQSFSKLLENPSNNVALVVRHLTVVTFEYMGYDNGQESSNKFERGAVTVLQRLPDLTAHLHMVKSLTLARMSWAECSPEILQNALSNLGMVEALELDRVIVRGRDAAVGVICAFPLLKTLSLNCFVWNDHLLDDSDPPQSVARHRQRPPFAIHLIDLCHSPPASLMRWLLDHISSIRTIQCFFVVLDDNPSIQTTLTSMGPSIQEIKIICNACFVLVGEHS